MKKKQKQNDDAFQINERLNSDVLSKLKTASKQLKENERVKSEEKREQERQRRIEKEKNKSFEELLGESSLDWKNFK
ncbi:YqkE family protein [Anaerobacillus arseniciselenatis]|nr:YqkE family protein [Anaerobacillus arseniciselenatis]